MGENIPTRMAYGAALAELGKENENLVVLEADIGKSTQSIVFGDKFPERYFNVGIAEQNEMCIAAGLASCGKIPFVSTYAVFASMRACEQVRTFIAYPNANVKICPSHGGLTPGNDGPTHQATEDLGIMRTIPNMTVCMPADATMTYKAVKAAAEFDGPLYLRLTRDAVPVIYDDQFEFEFGQGILLRTGTEAAIIANGDLVTQAIKASEALEERGISVAVIDMHTIKPLDKELVIEHCMDKRFVVTVEDHQINGGLGSAVAEVLVENCPVPMKRIGLQDTFAESGSYTELLKKYNMDARAIEDAVIRGLENK
ncbi:MAG: transketolase family protein [Bacteroidetes bacterium]|nr:MAG: transketolase family protein [Bacteroidota bacterium]